MRPFFGAFRRFRACREIHEKPTKNSISCAEPPIFTDVQENDVCGLGRGGVPDSQEFLHAVADQNVNLAPRLHRIASPHP